MENLISDCVCAYLHALPLLCGFLHGLTQRFSVMDDGFKLRVGQNPQQVIQDEEQLRRQNITVLHLSEITIIKTVKVYF